MNNEKRKHAGQQQVHEQPHIIDFRIQLAVVRVGVGLVLHKARVRALVAGAASLNQVGLINRRARIGGRQYLMRAVAVPASRRFNIAAQQAKLRVERIVICRELIRVARSADRRRLHAEFCFSWLQNLVRGVAIGANRSLLVAFDHALAMRSAHVLIVDLGVALAAGLRYVRLERRAFQILAAKDVVRSVAALAVGRHQQAPLAQRESVNRVDELGIHAGQAVLVGHSIVAVTLAAGIRHIERVNVRTRIRLGENLVCAAVTTCTGMIF